MGELLLLPDLKRVIPIFKNSLKEGFLMKVALNLNNKYYNSVKKMLEILLPQLDIYKLGEVDNPDLNVISLLDTEEGIKVESRLKGIEGLDDKIEDKEILSSVYTGQDFKRRCKERLKLSVYRLISNYLSKPLSPWGILIGVRPTKLVHYLVDRGLDYDRINSLLKEVYAVSGNKRDLITKVVKLERNYLLTREQVKERVNIYIGIPFCPTKCSYCSFASYPIKKYKRYINSFLEALSYEIKKVGQTINKLGLKVDTIYIGGGTPTVLSLQQLQELISQLEEYFITDKLKEFAVEAGRADTITLEKLQLLKEYNVDRISINPQSMQMKTLEAIGRRHTVKEVIGSFKLARKLGFSNINMDLIIGLPQENIDDVKETLKAIEDLQPDSLTLHTLAIKRASKFNQSLSVIDLPSAVEVVEMMNLSKDTAKRLGLIPYYMYRQKHSLGNLENVGYAKRGQESIYNILMMEERANIIGLGGGSITKLINSDDWRFKRLQNPKFPAQYIEEIKIRTSKKIEQLTSLFR